VVVIVHEEEEEEEEEDVIGIGCDAGADLWCVHSVTSLISGPLLKLVDGASLRLSLDDEGKTSVYVFLYYVSDPTGNSASCYRTITVHDAQMPTVTCPVEVTFPTDAGKPTALVYIPQYPYKPRPQHIDHELGHVWIDDNSILAG
jgi:hypothetical protein